MQLFRPLFLPLMFAFLNTTIRRSQTSIISSRIILSQFTYKSTSSFRVQPPRSSLMTMNYNTINLHDYIDAIEKEVMEGGETFQVQLRYQNKKPLIRTLLGIKSKEEFDRLLRSRKSLEEYEKMRVFSQQILRPRIQKLPPEKRSKASHFDEGLQKALKSSFTRGIQAFHRIASGRDYKGRVIDMVLDLVPELEQQCIQAMSPLTDDEMLMHTIDYVSNNQSFDCPSEQVEAAKKCLEMIQNVDGSVYSNNYGASKANGIECEQALLCWLQNEKPDDSFILSNCMINNCTTKSRVKYTKKGPRRVDNIIWTSSARDRVCSEFDAVILSSDSDVDSKQDEEPPTMISEIWEAKYSLSPSSLHDILTKKVSAIRTLTQDDKLSISYNGCHQTLGKQNSVALGLFGVELLPPANAFGQLQSTAISYALSSDVDVALQAVNKGYVELSNDIILWNLNDLRQKYVDSYKEFDIVVKIADS